MEASCRRRIAASALFLLMLSGGAIAFSQPLGIMTSQQKGQGREGVLCAPNGRYVFGQISDSSKDRFMLDTLTGRLWRIAERGDIGLYLTPVPYRSRDGKISTLPDQLPCPTHKNVKERKGRPK